MKQSDLIFILKAGYDKKKAKNKAYSLRSFSRDLQIDPSNLSKILNNQKIVGAALAQKLVKRMGLSDEEISSLEELSGKIHDRFYKNHDAETFNVLSDWTHYAILETFKLKNFNPTIKNISDRMQLSEAKIKKSIQNLVQVGLLQKNFENFLVPADESSSSILTTSTSHAHREQQKQILKGAISALEDIPLEHRSQSSMTMAINTDKLEDARKLIKKFRRDLGRLLSEKTDLNEVYQLSVSLYPVTFKKEKTK